MIIIRRKRMPKRKSITLVFTVVIAIAALFAATQVMAQDSCIVTAQLNKKTTVEYEIMFDPVVPCAADDGFPCEPDIYKAQFFITEIEGSTSKINEILISFPARTAYVKVVAVQNANGFAFYEPCTFSPYGYTCTDSVVEINFDANHPNPVVYFKVVTPGSTPNNVTLGTDAINVALGVGSVTSPCGPSGVSGPAMVVVDSQPPVIANTKDVVKVKDSNGDIHTGEVYFDELGNIVKVKRNGTEITDQANTLDGVLIRYWINNQWVPSAAGEPLNEVMPRSLSRSGPNDTCAYWYRGVYYDFCP
jgi:hypothetical protein